MHFLTFTIRSHWLSVIVLTDEQQVIHYKGNFDDLKSTIIVRFVQKVLNLLQKLCFDGCRGSTLEGMNVGSL